jgi:hypothetical protein
VDKLVDNPENQQDIEKDEAGETFEMREASAAAKEKTDNVEKEKRTKKRNERPPSSEEGKTARVTKKLKTTTSRPSEKAAGTPKGNVSEPNVDSNSKAQNLPPPSSTIDVTKHISMNLPDQSQPTVHPHHHLILPLKTHSLILAVKPCKKSSDKYLN